jgi:hypothetical protein
MKKSGIDITKLTCATDIWYKNIPCFIDTICSGKIYKIGVPTIRIVPKSKKTERVGEDYSAVIIQAKGMWVKTTDECLSLIAPPQKITWAQTKANIIDNYNINMYKKLIILLHKGHTLMLKLDTGEKINITIDNQGNIVHDSYIETINIVEAMSREKDNYKWYLLSGKSNEKSN